MSVLLGGQLYADVERGVDTSSFDAERLARELCDIVGAQSCSKAVVDRFNGLLLFIDFPGEPAIQHYRSALAGYSGTGPMTTAIILELFGFGSRRELFEKVSKGQDDAYYEFTK